MFEKNEIRKLIKQKRNTMAVDDAKAESLLAAKKFLESEIYLKSPVIMLYMPLGNETDTSIILKTAIADGKRVVLPVTDMANTDIIPVYITESTVFSQGAFSISEPADYEAACEEDINVVIVPGIAFDRSGVRVGFGKGFYDRFLSRTSAVKVGYCYDFQLCDEISADSHDISMDYIVTGNGIIKCSENRG